MSTTRKAVLAALFAAVASAVALAQGYDGYPTSDTDDIRQTVARLAYVSGDVSFARGDDPDEWQPADPNIPLTLGDRAWTAGGRLELQLHGGNLVRLASATDLTALNLTEDTKQLSLSAGTASFGIRRLGNDEVFEVDTPGAAITFERPGDYRIDVRENGSTRLQVRQGRAIVASGGGQVPLGAGDAILVEGFEPPRYDWIAIAPPDGWDRWVDERDARYASVRSYRYVSADIAGVEDLDRYGRWRQVPNYGWCWTPTYTAVGWRPYRAGRWIWQDPWGWTWVSAEPWGWAPYHYGRWVVWGSRWYWVPVAPRVAVVAYSPALVAFVGGGPGFSVSVGVNTDYIGWFPLAPRDPLVPWWGRPAVNVNVTHVTYVNRTYVTVVNQTTFVSSRVVTNNYVRDRTIVNQVERAPVVRGAIPIVPTRESIRVSARKAPAARPPAAFASRTVVTRAAPPPAPPRFDEKVTVIRENRGRPVTASEAHTIVTRESRAAAAPARAVRPAATDSGQVTLAPRGNDARAPRPEPVAPVRGRPTATKEQPVAPAAESSAPGRERPPAQAEPPAQGRPASPERQREQERPKTQERPERETVDSRPPARPTARPPAGGIPRADSEPRPLRETARESASGRGATAGSAAADSPGRSRSGTEPVEIRRASRGAAARPAGRAGASPVQTGAGRFGAAARPRPGPIDQTGTDEDAQERRQQEGPRVARRAGFLRERPRPPGALSLYPYAAIV